MVDDLLKCAEELEKRIGIRVGFTNELIQNDDWSFVIKLHALMEAALTYSICTRLNAPELERVVSRLDTSNNQSGKLAFAKALGILGSPQRKFIRRLSVLRNEIVHNVRSVEFSFENYKESLSESENFRFCSELSLHDLLSNDYRDGEIKLIALVNEIPKFGITQAALLIIGELILHVAKGETDAALKEFGEILIKRATDQALPDDDQ